MPAAVQDRAEPEGGPFFQREGILFLPTADGAEFRRPDDRGAAADRHAGGRSEPARHLWRARPAGAGGEPAATSPPRRWPRRSLPSPPPSTNARRPAASRRCRGRPCSAGASRDRRELRRFVLAQPVLDYDALEPGARATAAVREAAQALGLTPARGVSVRITGPVALDDDQLATLSEGAGFTTALSFGLLCLWLLLALRSLRLVAAILVTLVVGLDRLRHLRGRRRRPAQSDLGRLRRAVHRPRGRFRHPVQRALSRRAVPRRRSRRRAARDGARHRRPAHGGGGGDRGRIPVLRADRLYRRFRSRPHRRRGDAGGAGAQLHAAAGAADAAAAARRAAAGRLRLGRRRSTGSWSSGGARCWSLPALVAAAGAGADAAAAISISTRSICRTSNTEAMRVLDKLMPDPTDTPNTIEILAPSLAAAQALAARLDQLPEVAQTVTAASFVPEDQQAKLAMLADAATLLGPTLSPPSTKPPPSDAETLAAIAADRQGHGGGRTRTASPRRRRLPRGCAQVVARGAAALPMLRADLTTGLPRAARRSAPGAGGRAGHDRDAAAEISSANGSPRTAGRGSRSSPRAARPTTRRCAASSRRCVPVAPDATGTPVTIQESGNTVTRAFATAGDHRHHRHRHSAVGGAAAAVRRGAGAGAAGARRVADAGDRRAVRHAAQFRQHHHPAAAARHRRRVRHLFRHALAQSARAGCCNRAPRAPSCSAR